MKRLYLIVFSVLFSFSFGAYASVESLLKAPVAEQSYQSAGSKATSNKKESYAEQLAKVRAIMEKAKQEAKDGQLKPSSSEKPIEKTVKVSGHSEMAKELESQMNQMQQVNLQYQQSTNQKIAALSSKLQKLTQAMLMMNQQLSSLNNNHAVHQSNVPKTKTVSHSISYSTVFNYLAFAVAVLLAVLMGVLISRQKKE